MEKLFNFSLQTGVSSEGFESPERVIAHAIKSVRTIFRHGKMIKNVLKLRAIKRNLKNKKGNVVKNSWFFCQK